MQPFAMASAWILMKTVKCVLTDISSNAQLYAALDFIATQVHFQRCIFICTRLVLCLYALQCARPFYALLPSICIVCNIEDFVKMECSLM